MKTTTNSTLGVCISLCIAALASAQSPVGALAVDERQGDQWGWAVDYETAGAARSAALGECGAGCSVVLTFARCAAYAADQDPDSTAVGWAEAYSSAEQARSAARSECGSRGGSGCLVRVWGCNGSVVEEDLGLDRAVRREIQAGLQADGFDPGGADGMFGPRTRAAIRSWQSSQGARETGYLDGASVAALRSSSGRQSTFRERLGAPTAVPARQTATGQSAVPSASSSEVEVVFWQSIANSTNPVEFEAYLAQFPSGVFQALAEARLAVLRSPGGKATPAARSGVGGAGSPLGAGTRVAAGVDARPRPGAMFRPDQTCAGQPAGTSCWAEVSRQPGCYVWNPSLVETETGLTATWTGDCAGGLAQGTGTLTWAWDGIEHIGTGRLQDGKTNGQWVVRLPGTVHEGPFIDGKRHGHWVLRSGLGGVSEGPYVNGDRHGDWVMRSSTGTVQEGAYVNGERHGNWITRYSDANGFTAVTRWVNGERVDR